MMARVFGETSTVTMEDILEETGWGVYNNALIGIVSACNVCQAVTVVALSFALPLTTCDAFINEATLLTVAMCFFFGKAIGGFLLISSSDMTGRLWLVSNSLMIIFCSTFLAAFSHTGSVLSVAMFILGSGLEANTHAVRIHLAEILPKECRGKHLTTPSLLWTLSYPIASALAWKLSHYAVLDQRGNDMRLTAWRLMFAIAGGFNILVACITALIQPSPRYRMFKKQYDLAHNTLKLVFAINRSKYNENWPYKEGDLVNIISDFRINTEPHPVNCGEQIRVLLRRMCKTVRLLFKRRFITTTISLFIMKILLFNGVVQTHLMISKAITIRNETCGIVGHTIFHLFPPIGRRCVFEENIMLFTVFIILAFGLLVGQVVVFISVDKMGRKFTLIAGLVTCSVSIFMMAYWEFQSSSTIGEIFYVRILLGFIFLMGYTMSHSILDILEIEAFPTAARGTAAGVVNFYPNFIFCVFYTLWYRPCQLTFLVLGFLIAAAVGVAYFLPELKKKPMVE